MVNIPSLFSRLLWRTAGDAGDQSPARGRAVNE